MKSNLLKEIIKLTNDKVAFCTVSEVESDDVEIVIPDKNNNSKKQKSIKETLIRDHLQIVKIENKEAAKVEITITFLLSYMSESFPIGNCEIAPEIANIKVTSEISKILKFIEAA